RERRRCIAGLIGAGPARGDAAAIRPAVGERGAAHRPGGEVAAAPVDRDLVVVPTVHVGGPTWRSGAGDRRGRVVLEREGGRGGVARLIGARRTRSGGGAVGTAVGGRGRTGGDPGRRVRSVPRDGDRAPVPAVRVRPSVGTGSKRGRGRVVLERKGLRADVAGIVRARPARNGAPAVRPAVVEVGAAAGDPGGRVASVPV